MKLSDAVRLSHDHWQPSQILPRNDNLIRAIIALAWALWFGVGILVGHYVWLG